ncbi:MAG: hypothetical protein P8171_18945 [Candidatus Thiodiazotropha sp.]
MGAGHRHWIKYFRSKSSSFEVLGLLRAEKHPTYRLILDLIWTTGARISEVLALTPASFIEDGYGYWVILTTLKQ